MVCFGRGPKISSNSNSHTVILGIKILSLQKGIKRQQQPRQATFGICYCRAHPAPRLWLAPFLRSINPQESPASSPAQTFTQFIPNLWLLPRSPQILLSSQQQGQGQIFALCPAHSCGGYEAQIPLNCLSRSIKRLKTVIPPALISFLTALPSPQS